GPPADPYPTQAYGGVAPGSPDPTRAYGGHPQQGGYPPPGSPDPTRAYGGHPQQGYPPPGSPDSAPAYGGYPSAQPGPVSPGPAYGGQPFAQQGGFPTGQPYGEPSAPPAKKSRLGLILSLVLAGLLVLCVGGGGLAYVALSGDDDPAPVAGSSPGAGATPSAAATAEESPSVEPSPEPRIRLVTPKTLAGRPKSTDPELRALADEMVTDMKSTVRNETGAVGGFYGSPAKRNMLMVVAASGFVLDPAKELDDAVEELSGELAVTKMTAVPPGPLGGEARCGNGKSSDIPLGVCVWADQGSVGMIVMFFSSATKAKAQFATIRGQIEKKS
ncbi:hypothetical protein NCC78_26555, partial [Micromonospora phytophila]|uniref:hypothetical protein n=1 Tax=Micromonospora phytophila TaxID=709888 RepID=UPI0020303B29